jgi:hypothetical protein
MRSARLKKKLYRNYDNAVKKAERLLVAAMPPALTKKEEKYT